MPHSRTPTLSAPRSSRALMTRVKGMRGRRIDFSWTWNEKRKKAIEELNSARGKRCAAGLGGMEDKCWNQCDFGFSSMVLGFEDDADECQLT